MKLKHMIDATIKKESKCLRDGRREEADAWNTVAIALRQVYRVRQKTRVKVPV